MFPKHEDYESVFEIITSGFLENEQMPERRKKNNKFYNDFKFFCNEFMCSPKLKAKLKLREQIV